MVTSSSIQLAVGMPKYMTDQNGVNIQTGIQKQPAGRAYLQKNGFVSDGVADKTHHGGADRAVCIYPLEHYTKWEAEFDTRLEKAAFGENVTVSGQTEAQVLLGDIYQLGEAVIQVTQGRIPCDTINKRTGLPKLMMRIIDTGYTGYLCRVLQEGEVKAGSVMKLLEKDPAGVSVWYANQTYFHTPADKQAVKNILEVQPLAEDWRKKLEKKQRKFT